MPASLLRFPRSGVAETLSSLARQDGTATHPHFAGHGLASDGALTRDIADALHYLCVVHGRQPDIIDLAALRHPASSAGVFLTGAARAFAVERTFLSRLAVAAGPQPSTPGSADCETVTKAQQHALAMLGTSDRHGTAFGAAAALLIDWQALRGLLLRAADRLSVPVPECRLPSMAEVLGAATALAASANAERAIAFGAQQFFAQQRGLWSLLEARALARRDAA